MATASVVDSKIVVNGQTINNISVEGNTVYRVVADGNVSYDRKDYSLTVINFTYSAPLTGGSINVPALAITSTYSGYDDSNNRVNDAPADYTFSPATIPSNAMNDQARTGTITVVQDNSELTGSFSYRQPADSYEITNVMTGLSISLSNVSVIPAAGGSVNSCSVSVTGVGYELYEWASGARSTGDPITWAVSTGDCTFTWTGVTADTKGTDISHSQTEAGTLYCHAYYDGYTGDASATVYQAKNEIRGYTDYEYEMIVETNITGEYPAAGGTITIEYSALRGRKPIYDSNATGATVGTNASAELSTNLGTLATTAVTGTGTTTMTLGPNNNAARTVTITITSVDDSSKTGSTSFVQAATSAVYAYSYLSNYTGNGQLTTWEDIHDVSRGISNWSSPSQDVYDVQGTFRLGPNPAYSTVATDTYFYENDSLTFYTRNVTSAGAEGTEHLWYKNPAWSFGKSGSGNVAATDTSFTLTGSTNTSYGVTVKEGTTTIASTYDFSGSMTVNCGANTSTSPRTFTITFTENYPSAGELPYMASQTITQDGKVAGMIALSNNEWYYYLGDPDTFTLTVEATGTWKATFPGYYFYVNPSVGSAGITSVTVTARRRAPQSVGDQEIKFTLDSDSDVYDTLTVYYEE